MKALLFSSQAEAFVRISLTTSDRFIYVINLRLQILPFPIPNGDEPVTVEAERGNGWGRAVVDTSRAGCRR